MDAGVTFGSDELTFAEDADDWLEVKSLEFETWIIDDDTNVAHRSEAEMPVQPQDPKIFYRLNRELLLRQAKFGAAAGSELRRSGKAKYRTATVGRYRVAKEGWSIVAADDFEEPLVPASKARVSYSEAAEALRKIKLEDPEKAAGLRILRLSEVRI
jgi:hypothetical protein